MKKKVLYFVSRSLAKPSVAGENVDKVDKRGQNTFPYREGGYGVSRRRMSSTNERTPALSQNTPVQCLMALSTLSKERVKTTYPKDATNYGHSARGSKGGVKTLLLREGRLSRRLNRVSFVFVSSLCFALAFLSIFILNYSAVFTLSPSITRATDSSTTDSSTTDLSINVPTMIGVNVTGSNPQCTDGGTSNLCLSWSSDNTYASGRQTVAVAYNGSRAYTLQAITGDNRLYTSNNRFSLNYKCFFNNQADCATVGNVGSTYDFTYQIDQPQHTLTAETYVGSIRYAAAVEPDDDESQAVWEFNYLGAPQPFTAPKDGEYQLEVWGAGGGHSTAYTYHGETVGGYSVGTVELAAGDTLYVVVGDSGNSSGYNGGYPATPNGGAGGGATHIAKAKVGSGRLSDYESNIEELLIVAGGGGGNDFIQQSDDTSSLGNGGGWTAWQPYKDTTYGTIEGTFGQGSILCSGNATSADGNYDCGAAGGGGFRGGNSGYVKAGIGGGGSGYIGSSLLANKHMYGYNVTTSDEANTKTITGTCASEDPTADCAKIGSGYARITYLGE